MGKELYGLADPEYYKKWLCKEVTVKKVGKLDQWAVYIEEEETVHFIMEEIDHIVEDTEISESEESICVLLG